MARTDAIGRAGEHYVAAELNKRGAYASPFAGNVPGIDIVATDSKHERMVYIQVKTKHRTGNPWQMSLKHGWDVPQDFACLCLESCEAARCEEATGKGPNHPHHFNATNLLCLDEVKGRQDHYWVFVSLQELGYWVVPDDALRRPVRRQYVEYLRQRGGHRPGEKHDSLHASLNASDLKDWRDMRCTLALRLDGSGVS